MQVASGLTFFFPLPVTYQGLFLVQFFPWQNDHILIGSYSEAAKLDPSVSLGKWQFLPETPQIILLAWCMADSGFAEGAAGQVTDSGFR